MATPVETERRRVERFLQAFESMRAERAMHDWKWQMVSDYILPRRDFSVTRRPGQLRPNRVVSAVAANSNTRLAAMVLAYAVDYTPGAAEGRRRQINAWHSFRRWPLPSIVQDF